MKLARLKRRLKIVWLSVLCSWTWKNYYYRVPGIGKCKCTCHRLLGISYNHKYKQPEMSVYTCLCMCEINRLLKEALEVAKSL